MSGKAKQKGCVGWLFLFMVLLAGGLLIVAGCKKSEPTEETASAPPAMPMHEAEVKEVMAAAIEQTSCPIMGNPINKDIFVEYEGKKVYFCCEGCKAKFEENPEQYIAKLPQFKK
jgi:YHS domain-containing protein